MANIIFFIAICFMLYLYIIIFKHLIIIFIIIWILCPVIAFLINKYNSSKYITLVGLTKISKIILYASTTVSFSLFFSVDYIRDSVGTRFVEGYRSWGNYEMAVGTHGDQYATGADWRAKSPAGRWGLGSLVALIYLGILVVPIQTDLFSKEAIEHEKRRADFDYFIRMYIHKYRPDLSPHDRSHDEEFGQIVRKMNSKELDALIQFNRKANIDA